LILHWKSPAIQVYMRLLGTTSCQGMTYGTLRLNFLIDPDLFSII
jgi:hypothetical protein